MSFTNYELVYEALTQAGREDLIGFEKKCLIRPRKIKADTNANTGKYISDGYKKKSAAPVNNKANAKDTGKKKTIRNVHKKKGK